MKSKTLSKNCGVKTIMQNKGFPVAPMSASEIRRIARLCRSNVKKALSVIGKDSLKLALDMLPEGIMDEIQIDIASKNEMPADYAQAIPSQRKIKLREDTYNDLVRENPRARFTLAHELGHLFLNHRVDQTFARSHQEHTHECFRDSEWQADTFASEFLAPTQYYEAMTDQEIVSAFSISKQAVEVTRSKLEKDKKRITDPLNPQFAF